MESIALKGLFTKVVLLVYIYNVLGQLECPCLSGSGGFGLSATCDDGCFPLDRKCYKCPENCMTCSSTSYCDHCQTGFYGLVCEHSCSSCKNGQCSKISCMQGCADGYYLTQGGCEGCPSECNTCTSSSACTTCKTAYFGPRCQSICGDCKDNTCNKDTGECINGCWYNRYPSTGVCCPSTCSSCDSYSDCTSCAKGYYGPVCQYTCNNCRINTCNKVIGQCTYGCVDGYYQPQGQIGCDRCPRHCARCNSNIVCKACDSGYYGPSCVSKCDQNCKYGACDLLTGICSNGCVEGYYQNVTLCFLNCQIEFCHTCTPDNQACSVCKDGYYILNGKCFQCRSVCLNGECDKTDGSCTEGCIDGLASRYCNDQCYLNCIACEQYNKETCSSCKPWYYGQKCEHDCNTRCKRVDDDRPCAKRNGECTQGCENGYTGSTCSDECNPNCLSCDQYDQRSCVSCNPGYYGQACDEECSFKCGIVNNSMLCYKDTGECLANCISGYRGPTCDVPCEVGCQDGCDRDTGTCDRCKALYYGSSCEHTCNSTCYNPKNGSSVCDKQTGDCSLACIKPTCETLELDQTVESASPVTTPVIIGVATGFVAGIAMCITGIVIFVLLRRKRRNTSNAEQTNETLENNADTVYSVLDHADQGRTTDYTALHTLRGQPQEVQVISSPPTDGNNATYVNADGTTAEPEKDGYENVFL